ncbi:hypothetical protein BDV95DRAFT_606326 [Massariosphaeria phaeospora]|uniref:Uncharacterized protein n=1 Tax=Massariosphaeria phaeospora TaxID=100035 RepID=A0A7C8MBJ1_9PLEO|nr:hypothetical protein BDV95DRAFT_606326 [Massariosphaeria phaeospora]
MMFSTASLLAALALLPTLTLSAPALGSAKNVYIARCEPNDCFLGLLCEDPFTVVAYFRSGGITSENSTPTTLASLTGRNTAFEGTKRSVSVGADGTFVTNINADAKRAAKGSLVGDATLGTEPFVCFKDTETKFTVKYDLEKYTCTADYWCPSVQV